MDIEITKLSLEDGAVVKDESSFDIIDQNFENIKTVLNDTSVPTHTSQLINNSNFVTSTELSDTTLNKIDEFNTNFKNIGSGLIWQEEVATYSAIATTYPDPDVSWTVKTKDNGYTYRYDGTEWELIDSNLHEGETVFLTSEKPSSDGVWFDLSDVESTVGKNSVAKEVISYVDTQLSDMTNKVYARKFKPLLTNSITNGYIASSTGLGVAYTQEYILNRILAIKEQGFDAVQVFIALSVDANGVFLAGNLEDLSYIITQCEANGLGIHHVKIHGSQASTQLKLDTITSNITIENFETQWQTMCTNIANLFLGKTEKFIILNELNYFYTDTQYDTFVTSLINAIKTLGFKVGISTINPNDFLKMTDTNKSNIDFIATNWYPYISAKGLNTTNEDAVSALKSNFIIEWVKYCNTYYSEKPIIITETGCMDIEQALIDGWQWVFADNTTQNGAIQNIFLEALLEVFSDSNIECINLWWEWVSTLTKETIKEYFGGV